MIWKKDAFTAFIVKPDKMITEPKHKDRIKILPVQQYTKTTIPRTFNHLI